MKKVLSLIACIGLSLALNAQNKKVFGTKDGELIHESSESYEWPTDAKVLEKLDKWQDVKFGITNTGEGGFVNKEILDAMPAVEETQYVRHVRFEHPMRIL